MTMKTAIELVLKTKIEIFSLLMKIREKNFLLTREIQPSQ